ncbi:MAG: 1,6-anhydro-N-acetylmuramyl-L-alanine amidase AmpD [Methylophilaceae bacterium]|jgi:AmpD protein
MQNLQINLNGICSEAIYILSPNIDARPTPIDISLIVIHNISLPPNQYGGNGVIELFTNRLNPKEHPYYAKIAELKVSSHFFIRRDGTLLQFASCNDRAWHAGLSNWGGRDGCNDFSIGIELEGSDFEAFEPLQYETLNALITAIKECYSIQAITGHSDIAPGRKTDPGPYFDWSTVKT